MVPPTWLARAAGTKRIRYPDSRIFAQRSTSSNQAGAKAGSKPRISCEDGSPDEERGGRGLLHVERNAPVPVEVALAEEPPVPREEAVHEKGFPGERADRGEAPELKRFLSVPLERRGGRGNSRVGVELGEESRERGRAVDEGRVGVEEEERLRGREFRDLASADVARGAEAGVLSKPHHDGPGPLGLAGRSVLRGVVDDDDPGGSGNRGGSPADQPFRVPGDDDGPHAGEVGRRTGQADVHPGSPFSSGAARRAARSSGAVARRSRAAPASTRRARGSPTSRMASRRAGSGSG